MNFSLTGPPLSVHLEVFEVAARLSLALALGSIIGLERQWRQKMAGLVTNALVALGACGFILFSAMVGEGDPTRVAAQVVTGIGFLGAGVILREGINVHGLNTAATLWCSAMVGTFAGSGLVVPSTIAALFVVGTNLALQPLVRALNRRTMLSINVETVYKIELACARQHEASVRRLLMQNIASRAVGLQRIESVDVAHSDLVAIKAQVLAIRREDSMLEEIVGRLSLDSRVTSSAWTIFHAQTDL